MILSFKPKFVSKPWGGKAMSEFSPMLKAPEGTGEVILFQEDFDGKQCGAEQCLQRVASKQVIKLIATEEPLSIQYHIIKTETIMVLDAKPYGTVGYGLKMPLNGAIPHATLYAQALDWGRPEFLCPMKVEPCMPHCIGGGVFAIEMSSSPGETFRLYDFGRGRELVTPHGSFLYTSDHFNRTNQFAKYNNDRVEIRHDNKQSDMAHLKRFEMYKPPEVCRPCFVYAPFKETEIQTGRKKAITIGPDRLVYLSDEDHYAGQPLDEEGLVILIPVETWA